MSSLTSELSDPLASIDGWDSDLSSVHIVVLGLGKTGFSLADTAIELGAQVIVLSDDDGDLAQQAAETLRIVGAHGVVLGQGSTSELPHFADGAPADLVLTSPGIRPSNAALQAADAAGIPVWGDIEFAWRIQQRHGRKTPQWILITGTNGKTSTTSMTALMLRSAGFVVAAVGNIGTPILDAVRDPEDYDFFVVEASSFQLHWTYTVAPSASVCLNLAEDHVDWHGSMDAYASDKAKVYHNTTIACVYNAEQSATERMVEEAEVNEGARAVGFTTGMPAISMVGVVEGLIVDRAFIQDRMNSALELAPVSVIAPLVPRHLAANAAAAAALARANGATAESVRQGLEAFDAGAHRIQAVAQRDDVLWVNDSKATNPDAASASLAAFKPVIWIAGGDAKGARYDELVRAHRDRLRSVLLIGANPADLRASLERHAPDIPVFDFSTRQTEKDTDSTVAKQALRGAVVKAAELAQPGDTVLLAPAAASIDQFASYAERGETFIEAVSDFLKDDGR